MALSFRAVGKARFPFAFVVVEEKLYYLHFTQSTRSGGSFVRIHPTDDDVLQQAQADDLVEYE